MTQLERQTVDALDFSVEKHVDVSETDRQAAAKAAEYAARRPDASLAVQAIARASLRLPPAASDRDASPSPPETDLRRKLRSAIDARNKAHARYTNAAAAVTRADEKMAHAETELHQLGDVDSLVAIFNATRIRLEIEGGDVDSEIPRELQDKLDAKKRLEDRISSLGKARVELATELDSARDDLAGKQRLLESAARDVLRADETGLEKAVEAARARLNELSASLEALKTVSREPHPRAHLMLRESVDPRWGEKWSAAFARLLQDADAPLPGHQEP